MLTLARKQSNSDKNAYFDGKLERSRRVGKIPLSSFLTERPLCQEAGPSINSRLQATIMVTIWRARASVRPTTWESSGPVSISASRVEIGPRSKSWEEVTLGAPIVQNAWAQPLSPKSRLSSSMGEPCVLRDKESRT